MRCHRSIYIALPRPALISLVAALALCGHARGQDKPTADKPILRVDLGTLAKTPFDYIKANKPIDFYGGEEHVEQTSPTERTVRYTVYGPYKSLTIKLTETQFKAVAKNKKLFIHLTGAPGSTLTADVLGNHVDYAGSDPAPKFSWVE